MTEASSNDESAPSSTGTPSEGPSGLGQVETSVGGADSVPDTPDALPPDSTGAAVVAEE